MLAAGFEPRHKSELPRLGAMWQVTSGTQTHTHTHTHTHNSCMKRGSHFLLTYPATPCHTAPLLIVACRVVCTTLMEKLLFCRVPKATTTTAAAWGARNANALKNCI